MRIITLLIIALLGAVSARSSRGPTSGGGSAPRRSSSGNRSSSGRKGSNSNSSRGSSSLSRRPSPPQRNPIDEYDEDPLGFSDDDGDGDDDGDEYDDDYDVVAPASRGSGSRGGNNNRPSQSQQQQPRFDEYDDDEYDDDYPPSSRRRSGSGSGGGRRNDDYDDDYRRPPSGRRGPPPSSSSRGGRGRGGPPPSSSRGSGGRVVPYGPPGRRGGRRGPPPPSTLSRYTSAIREKMPDPTTVKDTMFSAASATKERTSQLSSSFYREVKGLTSSELEQVMLKSTRPDDTPVKSKHVERLVGVTYQISGKYDIYDAVLRKLWNKMAEKDMRTKLKSVYVLHRFAVDGGPDHQEALKQRLRALRKTKDPKRSSGGSGGGGRGGTRYFDSKVLIGVDNDPETAGYRAFLSRYAHYVLTRAQTFGGVFNEISLTSMPSSSPPSSKKGRKSKGGGSGGSSASKNQPKNPPLCEEHLKFAQMVLKAGLACTLHDGEDSESTAMCVERVAADLMGLTAAVAVALKRELKQQQQSISSSSSSSSTSKDSEEELVKQWCEFYADELLPETKKFCKKVTNKLDTYGLYLPSRISSSLSPELLEKGLKLGGGGGSSAAAGGEEKEEADGGGATAEEDASDEEEEAENTDKGETDATADDDGGASMAMSASASTPDDDDDEYDYDYDYDDDYD